MPAFLTPTALVPSSNPLRRALCVQRLTRHAPVAAHSPAMQLSREDPAEFDDDDATLGTSGNTYGMRVPYLTKEDRKYLDAASSSDEYVSRMMHIARKKEQQRKIRNAKSGAQTADDYIESLRRTPPQLPDIPVVSKGAGVAEDYMNSLKVRQTPDLSGAEYNSTGLNAGEEYIQNLNRMHEQNAASPDQVPPVVEPSEKTKKAVEDILELQAHLRHNAGVDASHLDSDPGPDAGKIEKDIQELEMQLRKVVSDGNELPDSPPATEDVAALDRKIEEMQKRVNDISNEPDLESRVSPNNQGKNVSEVDKQIGFLEEYLEKLKREDAAEGEMQTSATGIGNHEEDSSPMEMKGKIQDALQGLQKQVKQVPQPSGQVPPQLDELSQEEKMEAFEAIRRQIMKQRGQPQQEFGDPLAVPLPEKKISVPRDDEDDDLDTGSAKISDAFFTVSELEAEVKKYLFDTRSLLNEHERRMNALLENLKELE